MDDHDEMTSIVSEPSAETDNAEVIDKSLPVIRWLSIGAIVAGTGSLVLGTLSIILSSPLYSWQYTPCSGIYSGILAMAFYSLGMTGLVVAPQHFVFSIIGLNMCAIRQTKHGVEHCNPDRHASILAVQAVSIVCALLFEMVAISTAVYLSRKKRLVAFTGNPYAARYYSCCCNSYYKDI